jgi:hypothetical protein
MAEDGIERNMMTLSPLLHSSNNPKERRVSSDYYIVSYLNRSVLRQARNKVHQVNGFPLFSPGSTRQFTSYNQPDVFHDLLCADEIEQHVQ